MSQYYYRCTVSERIARNDDGLGAVQVVWVDRNDAFENQAVNIGEDPKRWYIVKHNGFKHKNELLPEDVIAVKAKSGIGEAFIGVINASLNPPQVPNPSSNNEVDLDAYF